MNTFYAAAAVLGGGWLVGYIWGRPVVREAERKATEERRLRQQLEE